MECVIEGLKVFSRSGKALVKGVSFSLEKGETLGLVGESGSGKTLTLKSIIGLLPAGLASSWEKRQVPENTSMIFQNPLGALDPLCPVFEQLCEVIMERQKVRRSEAEKRGEALLSRLSLPASVMGRCYPGNLSGGQCQRLLIAMALSCSPSLLLCDEPTTALDVTVQKQTIDLIRELQKELGFAMIFVTHNLAVASQLCERLAVMKDGEIIEEGSREEIFGNPAAEYTRRLIAAVPDIPEMEEAVMPRSGRQNDIGKA